jgi:Fic-DOC domain mobile mystery protein B
MGAGATPLDPDEAAGLLPAQITTREQLDEWEAENILEGERWAKAAARHRDVLDDAFLRELHARMFGATWRWAGTYRATGKNIGVEPTRIAVEVRDLVENTKAQLAARAAPLDEIAARFHHRLVWIHPFPNGNGRHARLLTDLLLQKNGTPPFAWGEGDLERAGEARERYLAALRSADARDFAPLLDFVRSAYNPRR